MRDDSDPKKWRMKEQTEMKHEIFGAYLKPWLYKISEISDSVNYVDGFAGRGRYEDGSIGSPIIAMNKASEISQGLQGKLEEFNCISVEKDKDIFSNLIEVIYEYKSDMPDFVNPQPNRKEFAEFAEEYLRQQQRNPDPAFIFIDPFGYSGLPFEIVSDLINLRESGVEVFITFMSGKMARFLETENHATAISETLGTDHWKEEVDFEAGKDERARQLLKVYEKQLRYEAEVEYVWPFEMTEETKDQNCYYLIHATNHFEGFRLMKTNMFHRGDNDQFAYLGPDHYRFEEEQQRLVDFGDVEEDDERSEELADYLFEKYEGKTLCFEELLRRELPESKHIDKHYRAACKQLKKESRAEIINHPEKGGAKKRGLKDPDEVEFVDRRLQSFGD